LETRPAVEIETQLYIGVNPREQSDHNIATFTGKNQIPIGWLFLFTPENKRTRQEEFPESWANLIDKKDEITEIGLDNIDDYLKNIVAFRTTIPAAKERLAEFKETFQSIPYIWSYFRVIDILDQQLESVITDLAANPTSTPMIRPDAPHPDTRKSQVSIKELEIDSTNGFGDDFDNPFAELESLGQGSSVVDDSFMDSFAGDDLLSDLQIATELDKLKQEEYDVEPLDEERDTGFLPIVVQFDQLVSDGRGKEIGKVLVLLERLLHHAKREGRLTRIMQDYLQDIFREAMATWRITGLLAEDFVQGDPSLLSSIMIGTPSPYVIIQETFDLEYWTTGTLQSGDERLMYTLSMLPSEQIHRAIKSGNLAEIADNIGSLLVTTQAIIPPRLSTVLLELSPSKSNIWGFRVLIQDIKKEYKATTILCSDPKISWEDDFKEKIKLPGVLEDWNIEYHARFEEFSDIDSYSIVFEGAKDIEETFQAFARWVRRHNLMYMNRYGVRGTVMYLKTILLDTQDKQLGQLIFDILTKLTELGISDAMDVLSDEAIVRKLPWLYS
jgi:hypothetical protein